MSEKLPINNFEWIEDTSQFNEGFIKNYNEESDKGYFVDTKGLLRLKLTMVCCLGTSNVGAQIDKKKIAKQTQIVPSSSLIYCNN